MRSRISEVVLLLCLLILIGLIRVYYGGSQGLMVVWKGELSYKDTFVNLKEILNQPKESLIADHPSVYFQLLGMDVLDDQQDQSRVQTIRRLRLHRQPGPRAQKVEDAPMQTGVDAN